MAAKPIKWLTLSLAALACWSAMSYAANTEMTTHSSMLEQRQSYLDAQRALKKNKLKQFRQLSARLINYPLYPYLLFEYHLNRLDQTSQATLIEFIEAYANSPVGNRLKQKWLDHIYQEKNYSQFLAHFEPGRYQQSRYRCYYANALYHSERQKEGIELGLKLWLTGKSQHQACDNLFDKLSDAEHISEALRWSRIVLAMREENAVLAKFLARDLKDDKKKYDIKQWLLIHHNPAHLTNPNFNLTDTELHREIILHGFKRWIRKDKQNSLDALPKMLSRYEFKPKELQTYLGYIGRYLSFSYHPESYYYLTQVDPAASDKQILKRRLMVSIWEANWPGVLTWSQTHWDLNQTDSDHLGSRYLFAKSLLKLSKTLGRDQLILNPETLPLPQPSAHLQQASQTKHSWSHPLSYASNEIVALDLYRLDKTPQALTKLAYAHFEIAAQYRRYHGFLASEQLEQPLKLHPNETRYHHRQFQAVAQLPAIARAREFFILKDRINATREFSFAVQGFSATERAIAARVAQSWGWHFQAILAATTSVQRNNLDIRFPKAFHNHVGFFAHQNEIDTDWVFSVIRQESAFKINARSGVGALGLMQVMPSTAKYVAKKNGINLGSHKDLLDPKLNILLGSAYLKELYDRFDQNIILATAAYNAGPYRVKRWRPAHRQMQGDLWVETIPFEETQNYVKNILTYQAIYKYHLGLSPRLSPDVHRLDQALEIK